MTHDEASLLLDPVQKLVYTFPQNKNRIDKIGRAYSIAQCCQIGQVGIRVCGRSPNSSCYTFLRIFFGDNEQREQRWSLCVCVVCTVYNHIEIEGNPQVWLGIRPLLLLISLHHVLSRDCARCTD